MAASSCTDRLLLSLSIHRAFRVDVLLHPNIWILSWRYCDGAITQGTYNDQYISIRIQDGHTMRCDTVAFLFIVLWTLVRSLSEVFGAKAFRAALTLEGQEVDGQTRGFRTLPSDVQEPRIALNVGICTRHIRRRERVKNKG